MSHTIGGTVVGVRGARSLRSFRFIRCHRSRPSAVARKVGDMRVFRRTLSHPKLVRAGRPRTRASPQLRITGSRSRYSARLERAATLISNGHHTEEWRECLGAALFPPSSITFSSSLSRIIVRPPTFVRRNLPLLSHAWIVHLLIPPRRRAASGTDSRLSIPIKFSPFVANWLDCQALLGQY